MTDRSTDPACQSSETVDRQTSNQKLSYQKPIIHSDEYRIGILGSSGVGKTSICAKFHRRTGTSVKFKSASYDSLRSLSCASIVSQSPLSTTNNVISVVITNSGPLGIKLRPDKTHNTFVSLQSFVRAANGSKYELERDGRLQIGDLLVAINRCTLADVSKQKMRDILDHFNSVGGPRVLTFIRPSPTNNRGPSQFDCPESTLADIGYQRGEDVLDVTMNSTTTTGIYIEKPAVNIRMSTIQVDGRGCRLELVDIPGHDYTSGAIQSWVRVLDGIVAVYSADSASSLLLLEKRYGQLVSLLHGRDMHQIPLVIVCNKTDTTADCKDELLLEGRTLAEAWGAGFVENSCLETGICNVLMLFEEMVREVDRKTTPSWDSRSSILGLGSMLSACVLDSCVAAGRGHRRRQSRIGSMLSSGSLTNHSNGSSNSNGNGNGFHQSTSHSHRRTKSCEDGNVSSSKSALSVRLSLPLFGFWRGPTVEETEVEDSIHSTVTDVHMMKVRGDDESTTSLSCSLHDVCNAIPAME